MVQIYERKSNAKLLVAILAMAMIVAGCAVVFSEDVNADTLTSDAGNAVTGSHDIAQASDLTTMAGEDKIITIGADGATFNLTGEVGNATTPVNVSFILNGELTIIGTGSLYVQSQVAIILGDAYAVTFNDTAAKLTIDNTTVTLDALNDEGERSSVFNSMYASGDAGSYGGEVAVINGATLNVVHSGSGSTWLGVKSGISDMPVLTVTGSTVNFNGTAAIQDVVITANNAQINFVDAYIGPSVQGGSTFTNTTVRSSTDMQGFFVKGDITLTNSSIEVTRTADATDRVGLLIMNAEAVEITMDDNSSISAGTIGLTSTYNDFTDSTENVTISGGHISGQFTAAMSDASTPATTQPTYVLEDTTVTGNSGLASGAQMQFNGDVANNGTFTNNGSLTNSTGASFANYGTFINSTGGSFTNSGDVYGDIVSGGGDYTGDQPQDLGSLGLKDTINTNTTVQGEAYLSGNLTIPEGITLTISSNSTLDMMDYSIQVYGTLVVESRGTITSTGTATNSIVLQSSGSIQNDGVIGDNRLVMITGGTEGGQVQMMGVSGVELSLTRSGSTYNLNVSGDIGRISGNATPTLIVSNVIVNADMTIGNRVNFTAVDTTVARNITLTNNGTANVDITLDNGASFVAAASTTGTIGASTGTVQTGGAISENSSVTLDGNARGLTFSVGRVTVPATAPGQDATNEQRFYVTGSAALVAGTTTNPITTADIQFSGRIFVNETFFVPEEITVETVSSGVFDLTSGGTIQVEQRTADLEIEYSGARYVVVTTVDTVDVETTYYTSFSNAMNAIGTAQNGEIFVAGSFTIDQNFTIGADQYISLDEGQSKVITIGENSEITVNEDGTIDNDAIAKINGRVIVNDGGVYDPADDESIYEVTSTNTETNTVIYSGFKVALDNAVSGDIVNIVANATYDGNMTIISGVTVNVVDDADLTVTGNVTVQQDGTLNLGVQSGLVVGTPGKEATINVAGTIDAEDGTISAAYGQNDQSQTIYADVDLYSTGSVITSSGGIVDTHVGINSAYYNDDVRVYTSVANAAAYAAENALPNGIYATGTFSESGDVTLDGVNLTIVGDGSEVTLGNVALDDARVIVGIDSNDSQPYNAFYSATVTALNGTGDAAVSSTLSVSRTSATIESDNTLASTGETEYTFTISAVTGGVTVSSGTVNYTGGNITISRLNSLNVESGARFVMGTDVTISLGSAEAGVDNNDYIVNNGTIEMCSTVTIGSSMVIGGDIVVDHEGTLRVATAAAANDADEVITLTITGNLSIVNDDDNNGTMTVYGALKVGATPELLGETATGTVSGEVTINQNQYSYVIVYNGASVTDATLRVGTNDAVSTQFLVNGVILGTLYGSSSVQVGTMDASVAGLENLTGDGDVSRNNFSWYAGTTAVNDATAVGLHTQLTAEIAYSDVTFTVSAGPGLTIYIDDVERNGTDVQLSIGQHTITVYVDAGYEGTPTATINGQTITGGTFEVTSDMINGNNIIAATGASPIDYSQSGSTAGSDDGMGLTDILLIILVVLIVIMAIMVAMRLMRS